MSHDNPQRSDETQKPTERSDEGSDRARTPEQVQALISALYDLNVDVEYVLDGLTQTLRSLRPAPSKPALAGPERRFLIETGVFAEFELEGLETAISRGVLQLVDVQSWMFRLLDTLSFDETASYLELVDEELLAAVNEGRVLAIQIGGRQRFPRWQFVTGPQGRLLPGLSKLIAAMPPATHATWAAFMNVPQEDLRGRGPRTPLQWLHEGGDISAVIELLEDDEW